MPALNTIFTSMGGARKWGLGISSGPLPVLVVLHLLMHGRHRDHGDGHKDQKTSEGELL